MQVSQLMKTLQVFLVNKDSRSEERIERTVIEVKSQRTQQD